MKNIVYELRQIRILWGRLSLQDAIRYRISTKMRLKSVRVTVHGCRLEVRPRSHDLSVAITSLGSEFEVLPKYLDPDFSGLIVDAGGYIGTAAIQFSRMFPKATIFCVEASQENYAVLSRNVVGRRNIIAEHRALSTDSGLEVSLHDRGTGEWGLTIVPDADHKYGGQAVEIGSVQTISISDIIGRFPEKSIGMLKLDIEGAEKELFQASQKELGDIAVIAVELHDKIILGCRAAFDRFSQNRKLVKLDGEKWLSLRRDHAPVGRKEISTGTPE